MQPRLTTLAAGATALLTTLALAGCGKSEIDVDKASTFIDSAVEKEIGAKVKAVDCPESVEVKAKSTFKCVVTGSDDTKGDAKVTQRDDKGNMVVSAPFLHPREAEGAIQSQLRKRARAATVTCPEIIVVAKGGEFDCKVVSAGPTKLVSATQTDTIGNFTYRERSE